MQYVGVGRLHLQQFVTWLQSEPLPLSWLPILHRLGASEHATHDVRCSVCKSPQIIGLRYRCVQCANFDMCQVRETELTNYATCSIFDNYVMYST